MKSRFTTYLLIVVVLGIWGAIVWKIFFRQPKDSEASAAPHVVVIAETSESDTLMLNYRDPFLGTVERPKAAPVVRIVQPTTPAAPKEEPPMPSYNVKYYGRIGRGADIYCIIEIDGQQHVMKHGDTEDGFNLISIAEDSVQIRKEGRVFSVAAIK